MPAAEKARQHWDSEILGEPQAPLYHRKGILSHSPPAWLSLRVSRAQNSPSVLQQAGSCAWAEGFVRLQASV